MSAKVSERVCASPGARSIRAPGSHPTAIPLDPMDRLADRFLELASRYARFGLSGAEHTRLLRLGRIVGAYYEVDPGDVIEEAIAEAEEEAL